MADTINGFAALRVYGMMAPKEAVRMRLQKENEIRAITEIIKEAVDCEKIYLFGSYAYGEPHKDSDLDFYVVVPDDAGRPIEVKRKIRANLGSMQRTTPIDIIAARSSRFADMSALPTMERKIVREGVLLYEQSGLSQRMV
jgi:predicted nucleotidyltransferase